MFLNTERKTLTESEWWPQRDAIELAELKCAISLRADWVLGRSVGPQTGEGVALESRCGCGAGYAECYTASPFGSRGGANPGGWCRSRGVRAPGERASTPAGYHGRRDT